MHIIVARLFNKVWTILENVLRKKISKLYSYDPPPPPQKKTLWPHPTPKDDDMNKLEFTPPNEAFT